MEIETTDNTSPSPQPEKKQRIDEEEDEEDDIGFVGGGGGEPWESGPEDSSSELSVCGEWQHPVS